MKTSRLLALLLAAAAAACAPALEDDAASSDSAQTERTPDLRPELAQMNDVSILFPLAKDDGELAGLIPASKVIAAESYEKAFGAPGTLLVGGTPAAPPHASLKVVAARFDPCFGDACESQVRLVLQPVKVSGGADDTAIHAFYPMSRDELKDTVESVIAVRRANAGDARLGALGPHPLMKKEGLLGKTSKALRAILEEAATPERLTRMTVFTTSGLGTAWNFTGFDLADGAATRMPIPNIPGAEMVAFFAGFRPGELSGEPPFTPAVKDAKAEDNMQLLGNGTWASRASVKAEDRQRAIDAAVRIENPTLHSPDTVDCASCHAAEPARRLVGEKKLKLTASRDAAFVADDLFVPAAETALTSAGAPGINVHMFSYKGTDAGVHQRTVNETAAVVAYMNEKVLDARRQ
ncbi:MAG: hypothetical protein KIT84_36860 [Labilithrix sp.]|nr:hypothetical protein [Labilithrix sp.]MCW5816628.1 hypothetical protein [Labilithrix sp.]